MKQVAKVLLIDDQDQYLLMTRSNHPRFGQDADLPGGTVEPGESVFHAALREVFEETGILLDQNTVREVCTTDTYSAHKTVYSLFIAKLPVRPVIRLSWEHADHTWLDRAIFLEIAKSSKDTYMHMVADVIGREVGVKGAQ